MAIPNKEANYPYITHPFAALTINFASEELKKIDLARLACLIHAANVHSEPGSNPSIKVLRLVSEETSYPSNNSIGVRLESRSFESLWS